MKLIQFIPKDLDKSSKQTTKSSLSEIKIQPNFRKPKIGDVYKILSDKFRQDKEYKVIKVGLKTDENEDPNSIKLEYTDDPDKLFWLNGDNLEYLFKNKLIKFIKHE